MLMLIYVKKIKLKLMKVGIINKGGGKMLKIEKNINSNGLDYILENGIELYEMDWNGELYENGMKNR